MPRDLLLSSGFLAFARHVGVLHAVEDRGVAVDAVVGTSSGALVGALWAAGLPAARIGALLGERRPLRYVAPHPRPWAGALSLDPLISWLATLLPADFSGLERPFAAGVMAPDGAARLLTRGPLPAAVAASCAIPRLFLPVTIDGATWRDGGLTDRLMVDPWRSWRGPRDGLAHLVAPRTGDDDGTGSLDGLTVIRTPRSGASLWSLGDVPAAVALARERAERVIDALG